MSKNVSETVDAVRKRIFPHEHVNPFPLCVFFFFFFLMSKPCRVESRVNFSNSLSVHPSKKNIQKNQTKQHRTRVNSALAEAAGFPAHVFIRL